MNAEDLMSIVGGVAFVVSGLVSLLVGIRIGIKIERDTGPEYHRGRGDGWFDGMRDAARIVRVVHQKQPYACPACAAGDVDAEIDGRLKRDADRAATEERLKLADEAVAVDEARARRIIDDHLDRARVAAEADVAKAKASIEGKR